MKISKFWIGPNFSFDTFENFDNLGFSSIKLLMLVKTLVDADLRLTSSPLNEATFEASLL